MKRTNTFEVRPRSKSDRELLRRLLDVSASLWNEFTYERRQRFFADESIWSTPDLHDRYKGVLSATTAQQIRRKNDAAWKSFFALLEDPDQDAHVPGYWGNEADGRDLRTYIRNDSYTLEWGDRSRLEIPVGTTLKQEYDLDRSERLRLEVAGRPKWDGDPCQLELYYDETSGTFRAIQPVEVPEDRQDSPLASNEAALDVGANNIVACTTTTGQQYLYEGRRLFERFRETTERITEYRRKLDDSQDISARIKRLYAKRSRRRNHGQDALVRDLVERLHADGVSVLYVGDLSGVLGDHGSAETNEKLHSFWAFRRLLRRLESVSEEYGLTVESRSEAWTSQECPACGSRAETTRSDDRFECPCGYEDHADLSASVVFLNRYADDSVGSTARPVRLVWNNHEWRPTTVAPCERTTASEERTNRSTTDSTRGNLAPVD
jgi:putative transposase